MSTGFAYDTKEQVRQAVEIVDLVGSCVQLRRQGRNFVGLCPWHEDSRPSLQVNPQRQSWKCWVCDIGGDVFSFVMQREGVDFRQALEILAERAGISLRQPKVAAKPGSPQDKRTLYKAAAWAEQQFHQFLLQSLQAEAARRYVEERGITPASVERFRIGYSPDQWQWLLDRAKTTEFSPHVLEAVGLAAKSDKTGSFYDFFRGRLIFPIRDTEHRAVAFGGRILPGADPNKVGGKYINSRENRLYSKSDQLYGLDIARDAVQKSRHIVIVEGYTDVVMAVQAGMENVAAVCGTALGERHIRLLRRYADTITLVLDGDEAGQRRTNEILELFIAADVDLRILTLPQGLDPFDFLLEKGAEPFQELLKKATDALQHKIRVECAGIDPAVDTHHANRALENILATVAKAPRLQSSTTTATRLREQQILARLARQFHLPESELRQRVNELRRRAKKRTASRIADTQQRTTSRPPSSFECELIEILIVQGDLAAEAATELPVSAIANQTAREIYATFLKIQSSGRQPDYSRVITELENPAAKSLLEQLADRAEEKLRTAQLGAGDRLRGLISEYQEREIVKQRRSTLAALEERRFDEQEELNALQMLIEQKRTRHGISAPTDG